MIETIKALLEFLPGPNQAALMKANEPEIKGLHSVYIFHSVQVIQDYLTGGFCGVDKQGSPIRVELFGRLDMKGLMKSCRKSDLEKSKLLQCEQIKQMWQEQSRKVSISESTEYNLLCNMYTAYTICIIMQFISIPESCK